MDKIRVVLVDDHPIILASLQRILSKAEEIEVVAEGSSGREAVEAAAQFSPDVLVLDIRLPDMEAAEVTRMLLEMESRTKILVLSGSIDKGMIQNLLRLGISAYIAKDEAQEWLVPAIKSVFQGVVCLSPMVQNQLSEPDNGKDLLAS